MHSDMMEEDYWCIHEPGEKQVIEPPTFQMGSSETNGVNDDLPWSGEAEARLKRVPFFVRSMVRGAVERYASQHSYREITPAVMAEARKNSGMQKMARH